MLSDEIPPNAMVAMFAVHKPYAGVIAEARVEPLHKRRIHIFELSEGLVCQ